MLVHSTFAVATPLVLSAFLLGCSTTVAAPAASPVPGTPCTQHAAAKPPEALGLYRLDFALSSGGAYTLTVEEDRNGEVMVGANVPLWTSPPGGAAPRQDVGLKLHCNVKPIGDDLLLHTNLEMSSVDEGGTGPVSIHKLVTASDTLVSPGKPVLVNSVEDPTLHKRYQLTVTATKVR